jgi:hypothetical protein
MHIMNSGYVGLRTLSVHLKLGQRFVLLISELPNIEIYFNFVIFSFLSLRNQCFLYGYSWIAHWKDRKKCARAHTHTHTHTRSSSFTSTHTLWFAGPLSRFLKSSRLLIYTHTRCLDIDTLRILYELKSWLRD